MATVKKSRRKTTSGVVKVAEQPRKTSKAITMPKEPRTTSLEPKLLSAAQQFQKLDIDDRRKAIKYYKEQHGANELLANQHDTLSGAIMRISWADTLEGSDYWYYIHKRFQSIGD